MLKVLLVDDEPFILQGLKVLLNWEEEGFEVYTALDGVSALEVLEKEKIDLVIADIKMPGMNGIELLKKVRESGNDVFYVILSGYAEFSYAQEALRYHCNAYILKPVEKESLEGVLKKVIEKNKDKEIEASRNNKLVKAFFEQNLRAAFRGKHSEDHIEYLTDKLPDNGQMRYVGIELDFSEDDGDYFGDEKNNYITKLYDIASEYLDDYSYLLVRDGFGDENVYDIGFLYLNFLAKEQQKSDEEYLKDMIAHIKRVSGLPIVMLVGRTVNGVEAISKSFTSVSMLHSLHGFREKKDIYFYEEEYQITDKGILLCKNKLDELISAIELNEQVKIKQKVDEFHNEMKKTGITGKTMNLNINYLLFQLIHIATEQDSEVNQEEILRLISENAYEQGIKRGSKTHLYRMACEYGEYLAQLRKKESKGVLAKVEEEVKNNYASNITLKELSEKYYVNSAYLGQLFRKRHGCTFKDYLNRHRLDEAAMLLRKTDEKIYIIAEKVGYKDVDYFVNKFIEAKGCTPAKYRKQES
ncbi:response regulator [Butyrivibrio sp. XB500-5]|uniref:response regulator transcription factor n=1 Tax=Butyrivibrio sp. XB500-5 TaxID=2364880 RepID=UPI000EAA4825|nr:response regulator [Butyrivibrio sp. XB500-5]RKM60968.1 response regulator [Butyrivibrio sp. XB500-5]